jgi:hypothetical protein
MPEEAGVVKLRERNKVSIFKDLSITDLKPAGKHDGGVILTHSD